MAAFSISDLNFLSTGPSWAARSTSKVSEFPQSSYACASAMRALQQKVRQLEEENSYYKQELEHIKQQSNSQLQAQLETFKQEIARLKEMLQSKMQAESETEQLRVEVQRLKETVQGLSQSKVHHHCSKCPKQQSPQAQCHRANSASLLRKDESRLSRIQPNFSKILRDSQEEPAHLAYKPGKLGVLSFKIDKGSRKMLRLNNRHSSKRPQR